MAGLFWNARGLGDLEKITFIKNALVDFKLRFICFKKLKKLLITWLGLKILVVIVLSPGALFLLLDSQVVF